MSIESLSLQVMKSQDLSDSEYTEIVELCSRAFEEDYRPFVDMFHNATHILGRNDGVLVTHALWITRWLQSGDSPLLRTAFVEGVATEESYRRRRFATVLLRRLACEIKDFNLGALSTGTPSIYAQLGWQLWRGSLFIRTDRGLMHTPNDSAMVLILPKTPPLDLDAPLSAEWREGELW